MPELKDEDLKFTYYVHDGHHGVRISHISNLFASCHEHKSQIKNKRDALLMLRQELEERGLLTPRVDPVKQFVYELISTGELNDEEERQDFEEHAIARVRAFEEAAFVKGYVKARDAASQICRAEASRGAVGNATALDCAESIDELEARHHNRK